MRNISVKLIQIWTSGSRDMFKDISILALVAKWNYLLNFDRRLYE